MKLQDNVVVYDNVQIGEGTSLEHFSVIGVPSQVGKPSLRNTEIGNNCIIGCHVTIFEGVSIGSNCLLDDYVNIGEGVKIGNRCKIIYGAKVMDASCILNDAIVGGFVCENAQIGSHSRVFGNLVHAHTNPSAGWDDVVEASPLIGPNVFIGFGATVIGGVNIGSNAYIAASAVVTKSVPERHIVVGVNKMIPLDKWSGKLSKSPFFERK